MINRLNSHVRCGVLVPGDDSKGRSNFKVRASQFKKNLGYTVQKILLRSLDQDSSKRRELLAVS